MIRFYAPDITLTGMLPESDSGHCCRVLRLNPGDEIETVDGRGNLSRCRITTANPRRVEAEVLSTVALGRTWPANLTIAVAPTKNSDRMEWLVEKMVELGIDTIVPLRCDRSERKDINRERLVKIAVSAMKQSLKAILPDIQPTTRIKDFIAGCDATQKFICYCNDSLPRLMLPSQMKPHTDTAVLIGPEGDFSPQEVKMALDAGFIPVSLGPSRLRTETAALVSCSMFHTINLLK